MKIHVIIDYSFIYYKYKFQLEKLNIKHLTSNVRDFWGEGTDEVENHDISEVYYSIKDIESIRRTLERQGDDAVMTICFDSKTERKDENTEYKANRTNRLGSLDYAKMQFTKRVLAQAGYNVYQVPGYESDDIIYTLVQKYKDSFDRTYIYTPDVDLFINIDQKSKVKIFRYKWTTGYSGIDFVSFDDYLTKELKCDIRFNTLLLYKCTVGDKSDNIKGVSRFGPKSYTELLRKYPITEAEAIGMIDPENVRKYLLRAFGECPDKLTEALDSLKMVVPRTVEGLVEVGNNSTLAKRNAVYSELNMKSLVEEVEDDDGEEETN